MNHDHNHHHHADENQAHQVTDPVCGMTVDPVVTDQHSEYHGTTYYFCGSGCRAAFEADPAKFAHKGGGPAAHDAHQH